MSDLIKLQYSFTKDSLLGLIVAIDIARNELNIQMQHRGKDFETLALIRRITEIRAAIVDQIEISRKEDNHG